MYVMKKEKNDEMIWMMDITEHMEEDPSEP